MLLEVKKKNFKLNKTFEAYFTSIYQNTWKYEVKFKNKHNTTSTFPDTLAYEETDTQYEIKLEQYRKLTNEEYNKLDTDSQKYLKIYKMTDEEITILIESYLDGELPEREKQQFEENIKTDKELANELMLHETIRSALGDEDLIDLRNKLSIIRDEYRRKEALKKRKIQAIVYASIAIIVISAFSFYFLYNKTYTNDQLYAMYYEHCDAGTIIQGETNQSKEIYTMAIITYDKG